MVKDLLAAEYDRRAKMEARGSTIVTASASLATLVFGLTVVLTGKDHTFTNSFATLPLIAALVAFVISAVLGTMAQNYPFGYWTISSKSLAQLTSPQISESVPAGCRIVREFDLVWRWGGFWGVDGCCRVREGL